MRAREKTFQRVWYQWLRTIPPTENFRRGRRRSQTHDVECELDHIISRVHRIGNGLVEGSQWEYSALTSKEIVELDNISSKLERQLIPEEEKERLRSYILVTRDLLRLMGAGLKE